MLPWNTTIEDVLSKFSMEDCKPVATPLETGTEQNRPEEEFDISLYQSAVGSLIYALVATRPDICFAVGVVSRHMSKPLGCH